jgi:hypothetical protein
VVLLLGYSTRELHKSTDVAALKSQLGPVSDPFDMLLFQACVEVE